MYDKETETVVFNFPNTLPKGNATLELKFTGELNDKMKGFYRSKYTTQAGEEKYMGVTQFEVNFDIIIDCKFSLCLLTWINLRQAWDSFQSFSSEEISKYNFSCLNSNACKQALKSDMVMVVWR